MRGKPRVDYQHSYYINNREKILKRSKERYQGKCVLCKQWKPEVDAFQHICNRCADRCSPHVIEG